MNFDALLHFVARGLWDVPWWGYVIYTLIVTHITIAGVTIYLHRCQSHRALDLHALPSHFFRFWLWLTTGMVTKEFAAIHRKHHAKVETVDDPHSPQIYGIKKLLLEGVELYRAESKNKETMERYGAGTPDDWIERNLYTRWSWTGVALMVIINFLLFGAIGVVIWAIQMVWIPVWATGVINGIGHWWGYRHYDCEDASRNIVPWGIIIGGEELHNNHHAYGSSAKFSSRWYEFDIGWGYIRTMELLGLAKVRKLAPPLVLSEESHASFENLQAVITHRYEVAQRSLKLLRQTWAEEVKSLKASRNAADHPRLAALKDGWSAMKVEASSLAGHEKDRLAKLLSESPRLAHIYTLRNELAELWQRSNESREQLTARWSAWCQRAELSTEPAMVALSRDLRRYA